MKIDYGISIKNSSDIFSLPRLPEFRIVELPGAVIADKNFSLPRSLDGKDIIIRNNDERRFFRTLADAGSSIRQEFYRMIQQKIAIAAKIGSCGITIVPDLENLLPLEKLPEKFRSVFGVYCGIAETNHIPLLLETRIPGKAADMPLEYIRFKHALLYPLQTICEIHPHEPGALDAALKFAAECKFECCTFRICFDAAAGNHLTGALFARLQKLIRPAGSDAPRLIFAPGDGADSGLYQELAGLIKKEGAA